MNKIQKIWLAVCGSLFLVPEILWSPLWNFSYELWFKKRIGSINLLRDGFLMDTENINILMIVFIIQAIGLLGLFFWFLFVKPRKIARITGLILSALGLFAIVAAFVLFYSFRLWR